MINVGTLMKNNKPITLRSICIPFAIMSLIVIVSVKINIAMSVKRNRGMKKLYFRLYLVIA
jgi:hypothetical protein